MTLTNAAKEHSFLAGMNDLQVAKLMALSHEVTFEENESILSAGEQSRNFYLMLSGNVCVEVSAPSYLVSIQALGPGDAFGWSALLDRHDTLFRVRAREHSRALCIDRDDLAAAFKTDPELALAVFRRALSLAAGRVQATEARLGELCGVRLPKDLCS
ncbi:MAG: cyclic nucleotide-binding domain-containing protein [Acidobacteriia bacterium]|nr:cyclic nucleotide-binding domain-containing protein [Terriglobia bacterium]